MKISLTVFHDAVRVRVDDGLVADLGWFNDEISACSAALEHVLMASAIQSWIRKLPEITIESSYKDDWSKVRTLKFSRATRVKHKADGRRVVCVPGTFNKPWVSK